MQVTDLCVIGLGPCGLSAAIYGATEGLETVAIGSVVGGQSSLSNAIENYFGFDQAVTGRELTRRAYEQALRFGVEVKNDKVASLSPDGSLWRIETDTVSYSAHSVVVASGSTLKHLQTSVDAPVSYSTVDTQDIVGKPVAVYGGGNSAGQAALYLARCASEVFLTVHRPLTTTMSAYLLDRIYANPKIRVIRGKVSDIARIFAFVGTTPNADFCEGLLPKDDEGFLIAPHLQYGLSGLFVAGDIRSGSVKRIASAVGEGAKAVTLAHEYFLERFKV